MPRPRFNKLPQEKRERILETAAKEFSAHGFEGASFNQILEKAEVSKGAAYYYFDDKADLFATALDYYSKQLAPIDSLDIGGLNAENFWTLFMEMYQQVYVRAYELPHAFGILRASAQLYHQKHPAMQPYLDELWNWSQTVLRRGQALGVVRTDLPDDLLMAIIVGLDDATDMWFVEHWDTLTLERVNFIATRLIDILRRALASAYA
jgi:AcrR family transcriptional regulator